MRRSRELRQRLVAALERNGSIRTPAVRDAFASIGRETFIPEIAEIRGLDYVYADEAIVTRERDGLPTSSSSQPTIMALMLEALALAPGHRVLEIGLGTGYNAALIKTLIGPTGTLTSIDIAPDVVAEATAALDRAGIVIETVVGNGENGYTPSGPYDRIIATASTAHVPRAWHEQLKPDGILVVPLRFDAMQLVAVLAPTSTGFMATEVIPGGFMPMRAGTDAPSSPGVTVNVDVNRGDGTSTSMSVSGGGLAGLEDDARGVLIGNLLTTPRRIPMPQYPIRALIWQAVMMLPSNRQIVVYQHGSGTRYGVVDQAGAAALGYLRLATEELVLNDIELYGDADALGAQLGEIASAWSAAGRPDLDRLRLAVDYAETEPPTWTLATSFHEGQRWSLGWSR